MSRFAQVLPLRIAGVGRPFRGCEDRQDGTPHLGGDGSPDAYCFGRRSGLVSAQVSADSQCDTTGRPFLVHHRHDGLCDCAIRRDHQTCVCRVGTPSVGGKLLPVEFCMAPDHNGCAGLRHHEPVVISKYSLFVFRKHYGVEAVERTLPQVEWRSCSQRSRWQLRAYRFRCGFSGLRSSNGGNAFCADRWATAAAQHRVPGLCSSQKSRTSHRRPATQPH